MNIIIATVTLNKQNLTVDSPSWQPWWDTLGYACCL